MDLGHARASRAWQETIRTERRISDRRQQLEQSGGALPASRRSSTPAEAAAPPSAESLRLIQHQQLQNLHREYLRPPSWSTGRPPSQQTFPARQQPFATLLDSRPARSTLNRHEWLSGMTGTGWQEQPRVMQSSRSWSEPNHYFRGLTDFATTSPNKPGFPVLKWRA